MLCSVCKKNHGGTINMRLDEFPQAEKLLTIPTNHFSITFESEIVGDDSQVIC